MKLILRYSQNEIVQMIMDWIVAKGHLERDKIAMVVFRNETGSVTPDIVCDIVSEEIDPDSPGEEPDEDEVAPPGEE